MRVLESSVVSLLMDEKRTEHEAYASRYPSAQSEKARDAFEYLLKEGIW
jgi:hypothetical protein